MERNYIGIGVLITVAFLLCAYFWPLPAYATAHRGDTAIEGEGSDADAVSDVSDTDNSDSDAAASDSNIDSNDSDTDSTEQAESPPQPVKAPAKSSVKPPAKTPAQAPAKAPPQPTPQTPPPASSKSGNWWHPRPGTKWQIQYVGKIDTPLKVDAYDIDLADVDMSFIELLHNKGIKAICYFSAGSYEKWRPDSKRMPASVLGKSNGWKDEKWLDIRKIEILKPIMASRIKLAVEKGCDAVDPDNVEGYDNKTGFSLTYKDQIAYNKMIADLAHTVGLAVGLKNDLDQIPDLIGDFDFAVNEQCFEQHTCDQLTPFVRANKAVFNVEYNIPVSSFCPQANKMNFDSLKKKLELDDKVEFCR